MKLLIANRGEIAIRIAAAAQDLDIPTVAIYSADDELSMHVRSADEAVCIEGNGARAYLDIDQVIAAAKDASCDAVHPGYGFLSENAAFALACEEAGIAFIGPTPETLTLFGNKSSARKFASENDVAIVRGSDGPISVDEARELFGELADGQGLLLKAINGGGGRGMRQVHELAELDEAFARASSEAKAVFGDAELYAEELINDARHIELQVVGDGGWRSKSGWRSRLQPATTTPKDR